MEEAEKLLGEDVEPVAEDRHVEVHPALLEGVAQLVRGRPFEGEADDALLVRARAEELEEVALRASSMLVVLFATCAMLHLALRDASIAVMREIGVETGGSNIQFAIHPQTGRMVVIEMNPRVSRSSARSPVRALPFSSSRPISCPTRR